MNRNDHIRAVVFDVDGTLLDTLPSLAAAANEVLAEAGLCAVPADRLRSALSEGLGPMFQYALGKVCKTFLPDCRDGTIAT